MFKRLTISALLLATALVGWSSAAPLAYAVSDTMQFGTLDLGSGVFTLIGHTTDLMYGIASTPLGLEGLTVDGILVRINPNNAAETVVGDTTLGTKTNVISSLGSTVFAISTDGILYAVDPATGSLTTVGSTGIPAFDQNDSYFSSLAGINGSLYYTLYDPTVGIGPSLYKINPADGSTQLTIPERAFVDAALASGGSYYFVTSTDDPSGARTFSVDPTTGTATTLAAVSPNVDTIFGLAAITVPEPGSLLLLGTGVGLLAFWRRRK